MSQQNLVIAGIVILAIVLVLRQTDRRDSHGNIPPVGHKFLYGEDAQVKDPKARKWLDAHMIADT